MKSFAHDLSSAVRDNRLTLAAAGVAYYFFLAFVPGLIALISLYGLLFSAQSAADQILSIASALPDSATDLVTDQLNAIVDASPTGLGFGLGIGIAVALLSASAGMQNLIRGINVAYGSVEIRAYARLRGLALLLTLGAIVVGVGTIYVATALPGWLSAAGLQSGTQTLIEILRWPTLVVALMIALALLLRIAVYPSEQRHGWFTWGVFVAALLWAVGTGLFGFFVSNFSRYNEVYGSLAGVIVLLLWLFLTSLAILLGAQIDAVNVDREAQAPLESQPEHASPPSSRARDFVAGLVLVAFAVGTVARRGRTR